MYDVIIIGAGASGLMCALTAKMLNKDLNILLLEKNNKIGKKILVTGNGKCNLGNKNINSNKYNNLGQFEGIDNSYLILLEKMGLLIKEDEKRLYPYSMQASTVCKTFEKSLNNLGVLIKYEYDVKDVKKENNLFVINDDLKARKVVIATGGKTYFKTGSTGKGYELLKKFGHTITDIYPSLTSLKTNYKYIKSIAGVRFDGVVSLLKDNKLIKEEKGQIQFTEDSVSGICVFNLSRNVARYINEKSNVVIKLDLMPEYNEDSILKLMPKDFKVVDSLSSMINDKLAGAISKELNIEDKIVSKLSENELKLLTNKIKNMNFNIIGTGDFASSQVTSGGAILNEFSDSLESKIVSNLYVTGEVLDVDGECGGYNLAWAFTSGMIVGKSI